MGRWSLELSAFPVNLASKLCGCKPDSGRKPVRQGTNHLLYTEVENPVESTAKVVSTALRG